jgi:hypothetical protein
MYGCMILANRLGLGSILALALACLAGALLQPAACESPAGRTAALLCTSTSTP